MFANFFYPALAFFVSVTSVAAAPTSISATTSLSASTPTSTGTSTSTSTGGNVVLNFDRDVVAIADTVTEQTATFLDQFVPDVNNRAIIAGQVADLINQAASDIADVTQRFRDAINNAFEPLLQDGANETLVSGSELVKDVVVAFSGLNIQQARAVGAADIDRSIVNLLNTLEVINGGNALRVASRLPLIVPATFDADTFNSLVRAVLPQTATLLGI